MRLKKEFGFLICCVCNLNSILQYISWHGRFQVCKKIIRYSNQFVCFSIKFYR